MTFIIAVLGNPGEEYKLTRHNTGRIVADALIKKFSLPEYSENIKNKVLVTKGEITRDKNEKDKIEIIAPNNFMNRSGASVAGYLGAKKPTNLIVIYDDLDLGLGSIKISYNRSAGGHRGLDSIIKALKTQEFTRIRVGISPTTPSGKLKKPHGDAEVEKHIIGPFKKPELEKLTKVIAPKVIEALQTIIFENKERAMERFNK